MNRNARSVLLQACCGLLMGCLLLAGAGQVCAQERRDVIDEPDVVASRVVELLRQHYVSVDKLQAVAAFVEGQRLRGRYAPHTRPEALAAALTEDLLQASQDKHNYVRVAPASPRGGDGAWQEAERQAERDTNFGIPLVQSHPGGVALIRISAFMEPQRSHAVALAAMAMTSQAAVLIFDIRGNGGGYGGLPEFIASYFFEEGPTHLSTHYHRQGGQMSTSTTFTAPLVPGGRRVGQAVFVLVDAKTASAAEYFAYILQSFGKAKVVGQRTAGAAHTNSFFELGPRLRLSLATGRPVSEANQQNWEGQGVAPDIECAPQAALSVAMEAARELMAKR